MKGYIRKRKGKNGASWQICVSLGYDPATGKYKKQWETVNGTKRDAEKRLAELIAQVENGGMVNKSQMTVADFLEYWMKNFCKPRLAVSTYVCYDNIVRNHLIPGLGAYKLVKLTPAAIQKYYVDALEGGRKLTNQTDTDPALSTTSVLNHHRVLHAALEKAVECGYLMRNPADAVEPPRKAKKEVSVLTPEQINQMLEEMRDSRIYPVVYLAVYTGMRLGEILGLKWDDIDFNRKIIYVRRAVRQPTTGEKAEMREDPFGTMGVFKESTKTNRSRVVDIGDEVAKFLGEWRAEQKERRERAGKFWVDNNLVFDRGDGQPWNPATVSNAFRGWAKRKGLDGFRFHGLRHTHASLLLMRGIPPKVVAERLGHATITLTVDTYGHLMPGFQKGAAATISDVLNPDEED